MTAPEPEEYDEEAAVAELLVIKDWCYELAGIVDSWLDARDRLRAAFGTERRKSDGIPEVVWDKEFGDAEDRVYAARFDEKDRREGSFGTVHLNTAWPLFQQQFQYWIDQYPRADALEVESMVKRVYEDEVVSKVMHAHKLIGSVVGHDDDGNEIRLDREDVAELVAPSSLTTAVVGLINVESRIMTSGGSKFGPSESNRRSKPKKARR